MAVLLVEDDLILRHTLSEFLNANGIQILEAADAEMALIMLGRAGHCITVLVTDLDLGQGDDGLVLAAKARLLLPDLHVVYVTGSPERLAGRRIAAWETVFFKPYRMALLSAVVSACDEPPSQQPWATQAPLLDGKAASSL